MLSSSNVPQPEFACWCPSSPCGGEHRRVLAEALAVHDQVLPVHVDLDVRDPALAQLVDHVEGHPDVAHQDLHRRLRVLVLEEQLDAVLGARLRGLGDPVEEPLPRLRVRGLERVVVALDPRPAHHVRADGAGHLGGLAGEPAGLGTHRRIGRHEPPSTEARVEMEARADRVDAVPVERVAHLVEVVAVQLAGIVELVVVDQVAETLDRATHALRPSSRPRGRAGTRPGRSA